MTFKERRLRGDLIEMYMVMCGRESINWAKPLNLKKTLKYLDQQRMNAETV